MGARLLSIKRHETDHHRRVTQHTENDMHTIRVKIVCKRRHDKSTPNAWRGDSVHGGRGSSRIDVHRNIHVHTRGAIILVQVMLYRVECAETANEEVILSENNSIPLGAHAATCLLWSFHNDAEEVTTCSHTVETNATICTEIQGAKRAYYAVAAENARSRANIGTAGGV